LKVPSHRRLEVQASGLENHSSAESDDPTIVGFRIARRVSDVLDVRCELKALKDLQSGKQLCGILVIETGAESAFIRLAPIETQAEQTDVVLEVISESGAERLL